MAVSSHLVWCSERSEESSSSAFASGILKSPGTEGRGKDKKMKCVNVQEKFWTIFKLSQRASKCWTSNIQISCGPAEWNIARAGMKMRNIYITLPHRYPPPPPLLWGSAHSCDYKWGLSIWTLNLNTQLVGQMICTVTSKSFKLINLESIRFWKSYTG